jgi:hypothetical protein
MAARIAMIAMTTKSSMSVKAERRVGLSCIIGFLICLIVPKWTNSNIPLLRPL